MNTHEKVTPLTRHDAASLPSAPIDRYCGAIAIIVDQNGKIVCQHELIDRDTSHGLPLDAATPVVMFAAGDGCCGKRE